LPQNASIGQLAVGEVGLNPAMEEQPTEGRHREMCLGLDAPQVGGVVVAYGHANAGGQVTAGFPTSLRHIAGLPCRHVSVDTYCHALVNSAAMCG